MRVLLVAVFMALAIYVASAEPFENSPAPASESQPVPQPRKEQGATARDDDGGTEPQSPDSIFFVLQSIETAIRDLIAEEDKIQREGEIKREIDDLRAQQEMAVWAARMTWATVGSLVLTAIALWAIVRTLHHTRRAADYANDMVDEAKRATEAANRTVAETTRIGEAQVRAYLTCIGGTFSANANYLAVQFKIRNTGQSPATHCLIRYRPMWYSPETGEVYLMERTVDIFSVGAGRDEEAGNLHTIRDSDLTSQMAVSFRDDDMIVNARCVMEWVDVFGQRQTLPFYIHEIGESTKSPITRLGSFHAANTRPTVAGDGQQGH
jgi:hypothetical protein